MKIKPSANQDYDNTHYQMLVTSRNYATARNQAVVDSEKMKHHGTHKKKVAIVGSGCAGLGAAWGLKSTDLEIHLFEKDVSHCHQAGV